MSDKLTDREFDRFIATDVMGLRPCDLWTPVNFGSAGGPGLVHGTWEKPISHDDHQCFPEVQGKLGGPPYYSTRIEPAMEIIKELNKRGYLFKMEQRSNEWTVCCHQLNMPPITACSVSDASLPKAICHAAGMALGITFASGYFAL